MIDPVTKQRKSVLFINRSYWPDVEATGQLLTELTEDLAERFEPTVICGQPNSTAGDESFVRSGSQERGGVRIRRVRHTTFAKRSVIGRLCNFATFFLSAFCSAIFCRRQSIVVVETDPFFLALMVPILKLRHRCKTVVYLQDLYPDIAVAVGRLEEGFVTKWIRVALFAIYRSTNAVVVLSEDMKERCVRHGVLDERVRVIPNWVDTSLVAPRKEHNRFRTTHHLDDAFVIMHSGNMGSSQRLERILEVAERLTSAEKVRFLLIGDGISKASLEQSAQSRELGNVTFLPYQPKAELAHSLSAADLQLISVTEASLACLMPSKFYGILASGTPVLAIAPRESELGKTILEQGVGYVADPGTPDVILDVIETALRSPEELKTMGRRARQLAERRYERKIVTSQFAEFLDRLGQPDAARLSRMNSSNTENQEHSTRQEPVCREESPAVL